MTILHQLSASIKHPYMLLIFSKSIKKSKSNREQQNSDNTISCYVSFFKMIINKH